MGDDIIIPSYLLEDSSNNSSDMFNSLSVDFDNSDYSESEESEEFETIEEEPEDETEEETEEEPEEDPEVNNIDVILTDIYDELVDIHADILVLTDSVNNVSLCVEQFANVFVEFVVVFVIMVLLKTVFDNLLHFFK